MTQDRIPLAGVVGHPIAHSRSPMLHGHWLRRYNLAGHYVPMDVDPDRLEETLRFLPTIGFVGVNVTLPHKVAAMKIADLVSDRATLIGAANTLIFRQDGRIHADNTDGFGFIENLRSSVPQWDPQAGPVTVFGAGGAARAVLASLLDVGVPEIRLTNRTRMRAEKLKEDFGNRVQVHDWVQAGNILDDISLLVNTSVLGMVGKQELRVPLDGLRPGTIVSDLVYTPLETRLLRIAKERGCIPVDGLGMLLYQAVPGFERWFGLRPDVDDMLRQAVLG